MRFIQFHPVYLILECVQQAHNNTKNVGGALRWEIKEQEIETSWIYGKVQTNIQMHKS